MHKHFILVFILNKYTFLQITWPQLTIFKHHWYQTYKKNLKAELWKYFRNSLNYSLKQKRTQSNMGYRMTLKTHTHTPPTNPNQKKTEWNNGLLINKFLTNNSYNAIQHWEHGFRHIFLKREGCVWKKSLSYNEVLTYQHNLIGILIKKCGELWN